MTNSTETIFSKIINKEIPAEIVYESEEILAFKDIAPVAPFHVLVIPKKRYESLATIPDEESVIISKCLVVANKIARENGFTESGYRIVTNIGENAGQSVFHIHFHLLAGRDFKWPPG